MWFPAFARALLKAQSPITTQVLPLYILGLLTLQSCGSLQKNEEDQTVNPSNLSGDQTSDSTDLNIPNDYADINSALAGPEVQSSNAKKLITIELSPGYQISTPVEIGRGDYSNVEIKCSGTILVSTSFPSDKHLFLGSYVRMPVLSCLFDMNKQGLDGYVIKDQSSGLISPEAGIINAGRNAVNLFQSSELVANGGVFYGAVANGVVAQELSTIHCRNCDVSRAGSNGFQANDGAHIFAREAVANNVGASAFYAVRSSSISALRAQGVGAGTNGALASRASTIDIDEANLDDAGQTGVYSAHASTISAVETSALRAGQYGLRAHGAVVAASRAQVSDAGIYGVLAQYFGEIMFYHGNANNSAGAYDVYSSHAGRIDAEYSTSDSDQSPASNRISTNTPNVYGASGVIHQ